MKPKKEKAPRKKKTIKGKEHFCQMGPTPDPRFMKCWFCDRIEVIRVT